MGPLAPQIKSEVLNNSASCHCPALEAQVLVMELPNLALHCDVIVLQEWDGNMLAWEEHRTTLSVPKRHSDVSALK